MWLDLDHILPTDTRRKVTAFVCYVHDQFQAPPTPIPVAWQIWASEGSPDQKTFRLYYQIEDVLTGPGYHRVRPKVFKRHVEYI